MIKPRKSLMHGSGSRKKAFIFVQTIHVTVVVFCQHQFLWSGGIDDVTNLPEILYQFLFVVRTCTWNRMCSFFKSAFLCMFRSFYVLSASKICTNSQSHEQMFTYIDENTNKYIALPSHTHRCTHSPPYIIAFPFICSLICKLA